MQKKHLLWMCVPDTFLRLVWQRLVPRRFAGLSAVLAGMLMALFAASGASAQTGNWMPNPAGPGWPAAGMSANEQYCLTYAAMAERDAVRNQSACRFSDPKDRWVTDFNAHFQRCLSAKSGEAEQETSARNTQLASCTLGTVTSHLTNALESSLEEQKLRRLVKVNGCSGTLLNTPVSGGERARAATTFWVLTAAHCIYEERMPSFVPVAGRVRSVDRHEVRLLPDNWSKIRVSAAWTSKVFKARYVKWYLDRDIALIMLGHEATALQPSPTQPILLRGHGDGLEVSDTRLRIYGQGDGVFAVGSPETGGSPTSGLGTYRWADFPLRFWNERGAVISQNNKIGAPQSLLGGDSGGPWYAGPGPYPVWLTAISQACLFETLASGKNWVTSGYWCFGSFLWPVVDDILATIAEHPEIIDTSVVPGEGQMMFDDTDRPGNDIARLVISGRFPNQCRTACINNDQCFAWTYVRRGYQGEENVCYLKSRASNNPVTNPCCISGSVTRVQAVPGFEPRIPPRISLPRQ